MFNRIGFWPMTIDHIRGIVPQDQTQLPALVGRLAFLIFAFLVGVNVLRSRQPEGYVADLLAAALVAQAVATLAFRREFGIPLNILFTLGLGAALASVLCSQLPDRWCPLHFVVLGLGAPLFI